MKVLFGFPGWGWKMYGLASFRSGSMWFIGFSKQLPKVGVGGTAPDISKCPACGGPADNGHDRCYPPSPYFCTKCEVLRPKRHNDKYTPMTVSTSINTPNERNNNVTKSF